MHCCCCGPTLWTTFIALTLTTDFWRTIIRGLREHSRTTGPLTREADRMRPSGTAAILVPVRPPAARTTWAV